MKKLIILLCALPTLALASASIQDSDFIERVINFVIFVAILWYFAFDAIKGIFVNRKNAIIARLQEVQDNLHKAKSESESSKKRLADSKKKADEIINAAKKEALLMGQKYEEQIRRDIEALDSALESSIDFEKRKITQEAVNELLNELVNSKELKLNKDDYVNIITKRIS